MIEINGDTPLNWQKRLMYLGGNLVRGVRGQLSHIPSTKFVPNLVEPGDSSPSRKQLNQFLQKQLPNLLNTTEDLDILDIGCGSGYLVKELQKLGFRGNYLGLDVYKHKDFPSKNMSEFSIKHHQCKIEDFGSDSKFDLIISNTALEHIKEDGLAMKKCESLLKSSGVQIHIVPSFWALFLYLYHGYRQYNPLRLKQILPKNSSWTIYRIGGAASFLLHSTLITVPNFVFGKDIRNELSFYSRTTQLANSADKKLPLLYSLYALVGRPNPKPQSNS